MHPTPTNETKDRCGGDATAAYLPIRGKFRKYGSAFFIWLLAAGLLVTYSTTFVGCASMGEYDKSKEAPKYQKHDRGGRGRGA